MLTSSTVIHADQLTGQVTNIDRPLYVYLIDTNNRQIIQAMALDESGHFVFDAFPQGIYSVLFRLQHNPVFPLDYSDVLIPVIHVNNQHNLGALTIIFEAGNRTGLSSIVDTYLSIDAAIYDNLDNVLIYPDKTENNYNQDYNYNDSGADTATPYGTGDLRM